MVKWVLFAMSFKGDELFWNVLIPLTYVVVSTYVLY